MKPLPPVPKTASALIRLALADLKKSAETPGYRILMSEWHNPAGGTCYVCLAGAMMAQTLGASPAMNCTPAYFTRSDEYGAAGWYHALHALNDMRQGWAELAGETWKPAALPVEDRYVPLYEEDPEGFIAVMEEMAADYERLETEAS